MNRPRSLLLGFHSSSSVLSSYYSSHLHYYRSNEWLTMESWGSPPRRTAVAMKNLLRFAFQGTEVILGDHPQPLSKRLLSKVVPVVQIGVMGVIAGWEQIFPMVGFIAPPPWYYNHRANKFAAIAGTWLVGHVLQSFLQSSGAFEVYFNGVLVFSKLKEGRFPGERVLKDLISRKMTNSRLANGALAL